MIKLTNPLIVGALHLPHYGRTNPQTSIAQLEDYAVINCKTFVDNGIDTLYLQDENPSSGKASEESLTVMAALGRLLKRECPALKLGIIVEAHDGIAPIAIAHACGADFVRIKVFTGAMLKYPGVQEGCGIEAVRYRTAIGSTVAIFADVHDRTGLPLGNVPLGMAANWTSKVGADALILTGMTYAQSLEFVAEGRKAVKDKPILIGGSVTEANIKEVLQHADGAVVSTSLMLDKKPENSLLHWDATKIRRFMDLVRSCA